jgi:hypothetical protein
MLPEAHHTSHIKTKNISARLLRGAVKICKLGKARSYDHNESISALIPFLRSFPQKISGNANSA